MTDLAVDRTALFPRAFWVAFGLNFLWINASEVFRYFAFVMPMMRDALQMVPGVAPMNLPVFLAWGVWDTILVFVATVVPWVLISARGCALPVALIAGTFVWMAIFVIFWFAMYNMALAGPGVLAVALPLAWVEMVVAALIVRWAFIRSLGEGRP